MEMNDADSIMDGINGSQYRPPTFQKLVNVSSEFAQVDSPCNMSNEQLSMQNQAMGSVSTLVCINLDSSNLIPEHKHSLQENKFELT